MKTQCKRSYKYFDKKSMFEDKKPASEINKQIIDIRVGTPHSRIFTFSSDSSHGFVKKDKPNPFWNLYDYTCMIVASPGLS
jgi:hypothetical protein